MANYSFGGFYYLQDNGGGNYSIIDDTPPAYQISNQSFSDGTADSNFSVNETLFSSAEDVYTYVGRFGDGIVISQQGTGEFFLATDDSGLSGDITVAAEDYPACFLQGTLIATPQGECAVEDLVIGDEVLTADGKACRIRWIGRQNIARLFADPLRSYPVRIAAGALGDGMPRRDLHLSPDHAVLVEGLLVQAGALINGISIQRVAAPPERFTYYHVELADHSLILAEGAPAETFADDASRRRFDNHAEWKALYGEELHPISEMDQPRVKSWRQIPMAVRARLARRAQALARRAGAAA